MPMFKKRFLWKKVRFFLVLTFHTVWSSDTVQSFHLTHFCIHCDQTKCRHFYFLCPKLVKATNMVHNMSNSRLVQWYAAHIYPTTAACQWNQLTVFMRYLPRFIELVQCFCNKYMLPLGGSECHTDLKKKSYFFIGTYIALLDYLQREILQSLTQHWLAVKRMIW